MGMSEQKRSYSSLKMLGPFSTNGLKRSKKKLKVTPPIWNILTSYLDVFVSNISE